MVKIKRLIYNHTMNSPVRLFKWTCKVCSKLVGDEMIIGFSSLISFSLTRIFFLLLNFREIKEKNWKLVYNNNNKSGNKK